MFYLKERNNFLKNQFLEVRGTPYFQKLVFSKKFSKSSENDMEVCIS